MLYFILVNVVVLAAEDMQNKVNCVRGTLQTFPEGTSIDIVQVAQFLNISEEYNQLRLPGWGTFAIRKPLILTLLTWLVTYHYSTCPFLST